MASDPQYYKFVSASGLRTDTLERRVLEILGRINAGRCISRAEIVTLSCYFDSPMTESEVTRLEDSVLGVLRSELVSLDHPMVLTS